MEWMNEIERAIEYIENHVPMDVGNCMVKALEKQLRLKELGFSDEVIENYKQFEDECIAKGFTFKSLIKALEKQPNNGWIPCSERLPDEIECQRYSGESCLYRKFVCTIKIDKDYELQTRRLYFNSDGHWMHGPSNYDEYVTAWQPLPTPYRTEVAK